MSSIEILLRRILLMWIQKVHKFLFVMTLQARWRKTVPAQYDRAKCSNNDDARDRNLVTHCIALRTQTLTSLQSVAHSLRKLSQFDSKYHAVISILYFPYGSPVLVMLGCILARIHCPAAKLPFTFIKYKIASEFNP